MDSPPSVRESEPPHTFRTGRLLIRPHPVVEFPTAIERASRKEARRPVETPRSRRALAGLDESGPIGSAATPEARRVLDAETPSAIPIVAKIARTSHGSAPSLRGARGTKRFATGGTARVRGLHLASALLVVAAFGVVGAVVGFGMRHMTVADVRGLDLAPNANAVAAAVALTPTLREDPTPQPIATSAAISPSNAGNAASALPPPPSPPKDTVPQHAVAAPQAPAATVAHAQPPAHAPVHAAAHAQAKAPAKHAAPVAWHPAPAAHPKAKAPPAKKPGGR